MGVQILLVERDQAEGELLSASLRDIGHLVTCVDSLAQAYASMPSDRLDLLLVAPESEHESTEMVRTLHASTQTHDLPVIVLSRNGDVRAKIAALDAGADDFMVKPCDAGELRARIYHQAAEVCRFAKEHHVDAMPDVVALMIYRLVATLDLRHDEPLSSRP